MVEYLQRYQVRQVSKSQTVIIRTRYNPIEIISGQLQQSQVGQVTQSAWNGTWQIILAQIPENITGFWLMRITW
jgi:hypothetical protein